MVPRRRSVENKWLKDYPGLHVYPDGRFYVIHPTTKKQASLGTRDKATALALYARLKAKWQPETIDAAAAALLQRLEGLEIPKSEGDHISFRDYAQRWRENVLGFLVDGKGNVTLKPTKILKGNGKPIEARTQRDYGRQCRQLELSAKSAFPLSDRQLLNKTRKMLADWIEHPRHYNHLLAVVSHIYRLAIAEGVANIDRNPASDIRPLPTQKRKVYIPDADYVRITTALIQHEYFNQVHDGEWLARICDLLYMLSSRPMDVFRIRDDSITLMEPDISLPEEERVYGEISFMHEKTDVDQVITMNADMREVVEWFLAFKRRHRIFSKKSLLCYPPYMGKHAGQPVTHRAMQKYWAEAVVAAGFPKGHYQLRDLRKKGLTDEYVRQGENDKGGHLTQRQADEYRLIKPPKRAKNTLVDLRKVVGK